MIVVRQREELEALEMRWLVHRPVADAPSGVEYERVFTNHYRAIYYFFIALDVREQDAHDLTQDTFLRVYKGMRRFRGETSLRQWILLIAMNVWKNELRRRAALKREGNVVSLEQMLESYRDGAGGQEIPDRGAEAHPAEQAVVAERVELLAEALGKLPSQMRRCALLRFVQDLKYREIAAAMQISIETVKSQIHQARRRLRDELRRGREPVREAAGESRA